MKVLLLGPALTQQGGMASVEKLIMQVMQSRTGVEMVHLSTHDEGTAGHRLWVFALAVVQLLRRLLTQQLDVIHLHVSERGSIVRSWLLIAIANLFNTPLLLHTHGSEFHTFYEQSPGWVRSLTRWAFQRATRVVVLSQSWEHYYREHCQLAPHQLQLLYNPVDISHPVPDRTGHSQRVNIVFVGRVGQRKGAFDLLQALAQMTPAARQRVRLWLAGDGETGQAHQLSASLGLTEQVEVLGWVGADDLTPLLAKADIFTLPSYNEGLPMAILEAMSWGLPIVTTPVGGIPEVVRSHHNGVLVEPGDTAALALASEQLVQQSEHRLALGQAARQTVLPFDLVAYGDQLCSTYRSLLPTPLRPSTYPAEGALSTKSSAL
ncbi:MAG: glycosyltransferase family 4 protein [Cyanobacteria bacterium P01_A01_bin.105]